MKIRTTMSIIIITATILACSRTLPANQISKRVESTAKQSYVFATYLTNDSIVITTSKDSIVTLTGTVSEWSHRSLALETVAGIPGVMGVKDNLIVKGDPLVESSDEWIAIKVKTMLMFHKDVSFKNTTVAINDGVVTLSGEASSAAQKELTTEYVNDIEGVKKVHNNLVVNLTGKTTVEKVGDFIDDASITSQVKLALMFHRSTSVIHTKVSTTNGIVTVSGKAKNSAEKVLVSKLVNDIKGVKNVVNNITVE